mmetsp:Transcript_80168/g.166842  ORF Transcript_80168/g.166842 Transcript_80168/m.166842 type:complete len:873 (+) Transcript_80168:18-2636(+)
MALSSFFGENSAARPTPNPLTPPQSEGDGGDGYTNTSLHTEGLKLCISRLTEVSKHLTMLDTTCVKKEQMDSLEARLVRILEAKLGEFEGRLSIEVAPTSPSAPRKSSKEVSASRSTTLFGSGADSTGVGDPGIYPPDVSQSIAQRVERLEKALSLDADNTEAPDLTKVQHLSERVSALERDMRRVTRKSGGGSSAALGEQVSISASKSAKKENSFTSRKVGPDDDGEEIFDADGEGNDASDDIAKAESPLDASQTWSFEESIWDASLFMFHPLLGRGESVHLSWLLFLNIVTSAIFIALTIIVLAEQGFTQEQLDGYKIWRRNIGHNVKYYDSLTFTSLTERMCYQDGTYPVEMSDGKSNDYAAMQAYLPDWDQYGAFGLFVSGPMLCFVALMAWSLTILNESMKVWRGFCAVRNLPITTSSEVSQQAKTLKVESLSSGRAALFLLLVLVRSVCIGLLWWGGCSFIVNYSIDLGDLILNAVALEMLLHVDQAFYCLVSSRVKNLIRNVQSLPASRNTRQLSGMDLPTITATVLFIAGLVLVMLSEVVPLMDRIDTASDILCGGNKDFVYTLDPYYLVYVSHSNPYNISIDTVTDYPHIHAIDEEISGDIPTVQWNGIHLPAQIGLEQLGHGVAGVQRVMSYDEKEATDNLQEMAGTECGNPFHYVIGLNRYVQLVYEGSGLEVSECADLAPYCNTIDALPRVACPITCGCAKPAGTLLLAAPVDGCPSSCEHADAHEESLMAASCTQKTTAELQTDEIWVAWSKQFGMKTDRLLGDPGKAEEKYDLCEHGEGDCAKTFLELGCGIVDAWKKKSIDVFDEEHDLCVGEYMGGDIKLKPLAVMCPETCGCVGTNQTSSELLGRFCPGTCAASS